MKGLGGSQGVATAREEAPSSTHTLSSPSLSLICLPLLAGAPTSPSAPPLAGAQTRGLEPILVLGLAPVGVIAAAWCRLCWDQQTDSLCQLGPMARNIRESSCQAICYERVDCALEPAHFVTAPHFLDADRDAGCTCKMPPTLPPQSQALNMACLCLLLPSLWTDVPLVDAIARKMASIVKHRYRLTSANTWSTNSSSRRGGRPPEGSTVPAGHAGTNGTGVSGVHSTGGGGLSGPGISVDAAGAQATTSVAPDGQAGPSVSASGHADSISGTQPHGPTDGHETLREPS